MHNMFFALKNKNLFPGHQVGRVPANLCTAFKHILQQDMASKIVGKIAGQAQLSSNPPSHHRFQPSGHPNVRDRPGGGAEIPCSYYMYLREHRFEEAMHRLEDFVPRADLDARVQA